jgi:hypothetical protein
MRVTGSSFAFSRLFHPWLSKAGRLAVATALAGASLSLVPAQAGEVTPGPLFGAPGDGEPYVDRLSPRVGWPPIPHRRPHVPYASSYDGDIESWAVYNPPPPLIPYKKRDYAGEEFALPPKVYEKSEKIFRDPEDRSYPGKVEPYYEEKPRHFYPEREKKRHDHGDDGHEDRSYVKRGHEEREYADRSYRKYYDEEEDRSYPEDRVYEQVHGGYGRLFHIKPSRPKPSYAALKALGRSMIEERKPDHPAGDSEMPAGYTFFGQFIDHDLTLDTRTDLGREIHGDYQLKNARTPELDLDNVYGGGPEESPPLYRLPYIRAGQLISHGGAPRHDLFRTRSSDRYGPAGGGAIALLGDPRDDENIIVSQLHAAFVAFHNRTADILIEQEFGDAREKFCGGDDCSVEELAEALPRNLKIKIFEQARDHVIHFYHRLILEDFLPWVIGPRHTASLIKRGRDFFYPEGFGNGEGRVRDVAIPVEFSAAAFRYGHSQVRDSFTLRDGHTYDLFANGENEGPRVFQPVTPEYLIDWRYFFEIGHKRPYGFNYARRIDPELVVSLHRLHFANIVGMGDVTSLASRNLARGKSLHLPSGQQIAKLILPVLAERGLLGKGEWNGEGEYWRSYLLPPDERIQYFLGEAETPLWYYILQEASLLGTRTYLRSAPAGEEDEHYSAGRHYQPASYKRRRYHGDDENGYGPDAGHRLGPVGAAIVGEVLTGLIDHYREKTGKGIDYRPIIKGSESLLYAPDGKKARHRYLVRNLLIDAGVADNH